MEDTTDEQPADGSNRAVADRAAALLQSFEHLQQAHERLSDEREALLKRQAEEAQARATLQQQLDYWQGEAGRTEERLLKEQAAARHYVETLAKQSEANEALEEAWRRDLLPGERARDRMQWLEQQVAVRDEEIGAQRKQLREVEKLGGQVLTLQHGLAVARHAEQAAKNALAPTQAENDQLKARLVQARDQLGRSENARMREVSELQQQLSTVSRQLRSCKSHAEDLQRRLDASHRPGAQAAGGRHAQPGRPSLLAVRGGRGAATSTDAGGMASAFPQHQNSVLYH